MKDLFYVFSSTAHSVLELNIFDLLDIVNERFVYHETRRACFNGLSKQELVSILLAYT